MSSLMFFILLSFACIACGQHEILTAAVNESLILVSSNSILGSYIFKFPAVLNTSSQSLEITKLKDEEESSDITALFGDIKEQRVFFVDTRKFYRSRSFLGSYSFATQSFTKHLNGLMGTAASIAYDWVTGNLYWADDARSAILVTDKTFKYIKVVIRILHEPSHLHVAVHAKKRLLFHIGLERMTANPRQLTFNIKVSDMAGKNATSVYQTSSVIRSFFIDYTDDRIYWGENAPRIFLNTQTNIMSCKLDGSDVKHHKTIPGAETKNIAAHRNTIYVAELQNRRSVDASRESMKYYVLHHLSKDGSASKNVTFDFAIDGLTVYSLDEETSIDKDEQPCSTMPQCDHICLPTRSARVCACSEGFVSSDTGCKTELIEDDFVLVVDVAEKRIFQFSTSSQALNYSVLPIEFSSNITDIAINEKSRWLYWVDGTNSEVYRSSLNGSNIMKIMDGRNVKSLEIDPFTGNVYFVDDDTKSINVMDDGGRHVRTLMMPVHDATNSSNIRAIALDNLNKFIYWIDYNGTLETGQLRRMSFDGSSQQLIIGSLLSPTALSIDDQRGSLFINNAVKDFQIGEVPLKRINITDMSYSQFEKITIHHKEFSSPRIIEMHLVGNSELYLTGNELSFLKLDLDKENLHGLSTEHIEIHFYQPRYFAVFSSSRWDFLSQFPSPCTNRTTQCNELCLDTSQITGGCVCGDGKSVNNCKNIYTTPLQDAIGAGAIVGIIFGVLAFLFITFFVIRTINRKKKKTTENGQFENPINF